MFWVVWVFCELFVGWRGGGVCVCGCGIDGVGWWFVDVDVDVDVVRLILDDFWFASNRTGWLNCLVRVFWVKFRWKSWMRLVVRRVCLRLWVNMNVWSSARRRNVERRRRLRSSFVSKEKSLNVLVDRLRWVRRNEKGWRWIWRINVRCSFFCDGNVLSDDLSFVARFRAAYRTFLRIFLY